MKAKPKFLIVLVTAPDLRVARRLARAALKERLVACVNLVPGVESHYQWKGALETAREVLLVLKTSSRCLRALEKLVLARHPYDTPEFVVLPLSGGNRRYLDWLKSCVE
jgi:periplasmic divalent cation tolerance protein